MQWFIEHIKIPPYGAYAILRKLSSTCKLASAYNHDAVEASGEPTSGIVWASQPWQESCGATRMSRLRPNPLDGRRTHIAVGKCQPEGDYESELAHSAFV
jgi:hypothetical protein